MRTVRGSTTRAKAPTLLGIGRKTATLMRLLESKPGAEAKSIAAPRSLTPTAVIYKIMGKMFAILSVRGGEYVILKCDPNLVPMLREQYTGIGHRTHLDRRFWICVQLDADVPAKEIRRLLDHSYGLVVAGLTVKQQAKLAALRV